MAAGACGPSFETPRARGARLLRMRVVCAAGVQMHFITLASETDFEGWRKAARALALNKVAPADVTWTVQGNEPELFQPSELAPLLETPHAAFNVPAKFVELAQTAILHRDP